MYPVNMTSGAMRNTEGVACLRGCAASRLNVSSGNSSSHVFCPQWLLGFGVLVNLQRH